MMWMTLGIFDPTTLGMNIAPPYSIVLGGSGGGSTTNKPGELKNKIGTEAQKENGV
jgi:hypothetical protein